MSDLDSPDSEPDPRQLPRREERRPVELKGYAVLEDGSTHPVTVLDLSYDGCGIEILTPLQPGDLIRLSVSRRGVIDAEVRWYSSGKAGLVFHPEGSSQASDEDHVQRDGLRVPLGITATIKRCDRPGYRAEVNDVSANGFRFGFVDKPEIGETVLVTIDGLQPMEAMVRWVAGFEAGVQFRRSIHPAVFALLLQRFDARAPKG